MKYEILPRIQSLVKYLPEKDIAIANKFIASRNFDDLRDLVDSAIIRTKRNHNSKVHKKDYEGVDIGLLEELFQEVLLYCSFLSIDDLENNNEDEEDLIYEEYY